MERILILDVTGVILAKYSMHGFFKESLVNGHLRGDAYEIKVVAFHFVSKVEKGCDEKCGIPKFSRRHAGENHD